MDKPTLASIAVIVSPFQVQWSQDVLERLFVTAMILSRFSAGAIQLRARMIGRLGVEALVQRPRRQTQGLPSRRHLHRLELQILNGLAA
jgi:hypothetical protein